MTYERIETVEAFQVPFELAVQVRSSTEKVYPGQWIVKDEYGCNSIWSDDDFKETFKPCLKVNI